MIHAVIMAGGKGTRFWPVSRAIRSKQFIDVVGDESLLTLTIKRLKPFIKSENIWIVGNKDQKEYLLLNKLDVPEDQILYEPIGKNTAPCIGWAGVEIQKKDSSAMMIVLPADHLIQDHISFQETLNKAVVFAQQNQALVTIGIKPTFAHTGYGYIEIANKDEEINKVTAFKEKPDLTTAEDYLKTGKFFWNSGIFIWSVKKILDLIKLNLPDLALELTKLERLNYQDKNYQPVLNLVFQNMPSISIDYGIMEKAVNETYLIKSNFDWSDLGNWSSLEEFLIKDDNQNAFSNQIISLNSKNNLIYSQKRLIALVDVEDLIVVDSEDAILIMPKKSDQRIKELYEKLPQKFK